MLCKLSFKNIKKSIKDYSIYFFTLVFAVSIFYIFNSIEAQNAMLSLTGSKYDVIKSLVVLINYLSIFVSAILGFLIIYSNNFLIKRRKKEIGLYLTLGMSKRKVSTILVLETLLIGLISLGVGLIMGVFLSQFLSIFTAKLFEVNMSNYKFIFSSSAILKTILYFGIIFILVIIFNVISLNRYKLIDLINANKKNEKVKFRNKYITFISFILAVLLIGRAYYLLFNNALLNMDKTMILMLIYGALGTLLLFFSLSGFLLKLFQRCKKIYYKNLNMFVLKQINNKINTTVFSTTIICLMLLLTIGILSTSISMAQIYNAGLSENNLTDFTAAFSTNTYRVNENNEYIPVDQESITDITKDSTFKKYVNNYIIFNKYYDEELCMEDLLTKEAKNNLIKEYGAGLSLNFNIPMLKESDYNKIMNIINKSDDIIDIKDNEFLLLSNIDLVIKHYSSFYENKGSINVNNHTLTPGSDKIIVTAIENFNTNGNDGILVVSDNVIEGLDYNSITMIGNYNKSNDINKLDEEFSNYIFNYSNTLQIRTRINMQESSLGIKIIVTFIGLYLGITFAICSATVLAIGQLSESSDNKDRYLVLKQLGADDKMTKKALLTQIGVSFMFPLVIAIIHSYFGLREINSIITIMANLDLTSNIILTSLFVIIIYGGYFIATYLCSKNIIKN